MSLSVARPSALSADDCPPGMVDDGSGGCTPYVPPSGGIDSANPSYVPPTGGLVDYGYHPPVEDQPTAAGMTLLTAIFLAPFFL